MRKWNRNTGLSVGEPWRGNGGNIWTLALSPDGKTIACGRQNGSIQRWNTDGEMMEGVWMGHSKAVRSLSWSPNGDHIASGSNDGKILVRKADSGEVEVGPIETKQDEVFALAYSPSGSKIASGGWNHTICIWDSKTGELVVGPMKDLTNSAWSVVWSVVWSLDSSKLYSASNEFARVFDSESGELLHSFKHDNSLYSIALSPTANVLACVGVEGIAQLWDTESHKPLGQPFGEEDCTIPVCVSFSQDGTHLAYGGTGKTITLWMVKDIAPELAQGDTQATRPESPSSLSRALEVDATRGDGITDEEHNNLYDNFFQSSEPSFPSAPSGFRLQYLFSARFLNVLIPSRRRLPSNKSQEHHKRTSFARLARTHSPISTTTPTQPIAGEEDEENDESSCSVNALEQNKDTGVKEPPANAQIPPHDAIISSAKLDSRDSGNFWTRLMHARVKNPTSSTTNTRSNAVGVSAVRGFQRYVAREPKKHKTKLSAVTSGTPVAPVHASSLSQAGPSSQVGPAQTGTASSQIVTGQSGPSSHAMTGHSNYSSDSHSIIEGSCMRFLDKICFPRGHYYQDS